MQEHLFQPIMTDAPEPGHSVNDVLPLDTFLRLLREEEDYYTGEQNNTKLMITRLRKIFYDQWGWNSEVIREAANIPGRYITQVLDEPTPDSKPLRRSRVHEYVPKHRQVVYAADDRLHPELAGQVPEIYRLDHQELRLPDGSTCDIGHVLAGLDAANHAMPVSPLPTPLMFLYRLLPHVDTNLEVATWLADIGSTSGDYLFCYLYKNRRRKLTQAQDENFILIDTPGSDMIGNIDPYVILKAYDTRCSEGMRVSEIFEDYYALSGRHYSRRATIFCATVGLDGWDGKAFVNEKAWMKNFSRHLRYDVCFQIFSLTDEKLRSMWLPLAVWLGMYKSVLKVDYLLGIWLDSLKKLVAAEELASSASLREQRQTHT